MKKPDPRISVLLHLLDEAYVKKAWHGPNLRGSIRGVTAAEASWQPASGRHNIRELVVHAAYWKYCVRRRLTGEARGTFPLSGSNWLRLPPRSEKAWRAERELLEGEHQALRGAVAAFPASRLERKLPGKVGITALRLIAGVALHDVYHTGQIQLLKALQRRRRAR